MLPAYLGAFGLTLVVEVPVYVVGAHRRRRACRWARAVAVAVGVNVVTHPLLWWSLRPCSGRPGVPVAADRRGDRGVRGGVGAAGRVDAAPGRTRPTSRLLAAVSVAANAASTLAGLLIMG